MGIFLSKYIPLIKTPGGRAAIEQYQIPPYVDGSCRREPDFESVFPSITALCHGRNFAPRLKEGDIACYITFRSHYPGYSEPHWRFTALLEVCERLDSHEEAAAWYHQRHLPLPSNCLVPYNPPLPLDKTTARLSRTTTPTFLPERYTKRLLPMMNADPMLSKWDQYYKEKIEKKRCGVFLVCRPSYVNVQDPPIITKEILLEIFAKKAYQRTPPEITSAQLNKLKRVCIKKE